MWREIYLDFVESSTIVSVVNEFWKSVKLWRSDSHELLVDFYCTSCTRYGAK